MENYFLNITNFHINQNGKVATYSRVTSGEYDVETGKSSNTVTQYNIRMYKKSIKVNQYNYPNLIGKDVAMFYITADTLGFVPSVRDSIKFDGVIYTIDSYMGHAALGQVILYKIIGVRG